VLQEWAYQSRYTKDICFHLGPILVIASDMPSSFFYVLTVDMGSFSEGTRFLHPHGAAGDRGKGGGG
jgi:hypothetical protein